MKSWFIAAAVLASILSTNAGEPALGKSVAGWPGVKYAKVVAYYFEPKFEVEGKFSTIDDEGFNAAALAKCKLQEKAMQPAQVDRLLQAGFASHVRFARAACYTPHHVFVFYNEDGESVAACEFCLSCKGFATWPQEKAGKEPSYERPHNYVELAMLCADLGLKLSPFEPPLDLLVRRMRQELRETR